MWNYRAIRDDFGSAVPRDTFWSCCVSAVLRDIFCPGVLWNIFSGLAVLRDIFDMPVLRDISDLGVLRDVFGLLLSPENIRLVLRMLCATRRYCLCCALRRLSSCCCLRLQATLSAVVRCWSVYRTYIRHRLTACEFLVPSNIRWQI